MPIFRPDINPEILRWAREWAGLTLEEVAEKVPGYEKWERGEKRPTMKQLEAVANRFHTPLGYFFLPDPPNVEVPIPDFRTLGDQRPATPSPDLLETLHQMLRRQDWMRQYLIENGAEPLDFVGRAQVGEPIDVLATDIRETLGLTPKWAAVHASHKEALRHFRRTIEDARIMIVIMGYAGRSTRRTFNVEEFRGFVLSDEYAPLIFVNGRDAKEAQMFTLAHELAHLWVGQDALFDLPQLMPAGVDAEIYCNRVAAEFLVPAEEFGAMWEHVSDKKDPFPALAQQFKVSQIVVARKALDLNYIRKDHFFEFYRRRKEETAEAPLSRSGRGNYWNTQSIRIGSLFGTAVVQAVKEGRLLYTDAYEMTGLRASTLDSYADQLGLSL